MKRALLAVLIVIAALLAFALFRGRTPVSEVERNRAFAQSMAGVTLAGESTRLNRQGVSGPERYHIDSVTHLSGDTWLFRTRLKYHDNEIPVPIPLTVKWAGDTPVITLTDLAIPGVGTYTARVLLYRDQYAGTWSGEKSGGQLFGKIVRETSR
jgi:type II secretory pathway pseudopilin PulG